MLLSAGLVNHANRYHHYHGAGADEVQREADNRDVLVIGPAIYNDRVDQAEQKNNRASKSDNQDRLWWGDSFAQWIMAITGIGALAASALSVGLVVWTFRETRKLTRIESRAYILTENGTVCRIVPKTGNHYQIHCSLDLKNSGQTPAFDVTLIGVFGWFTEDVIKQWEPSGQPSSKGVFAPGAINTTNKRFEENFTDIDIGAKNLAKKTIWARGIIRYRDFADQWWEHGFWYRFKDPLRLCDEGVGKTVDFPMTPHISGNYLKMIEPPKD